VLTVTRPRTREAGSVRRRPLIFWSGVLCCTAGTLLHLPMYLAARDMNYHMAGMRPDPPMLAGLALIALGLAVTAYGLVPRGGPPRTDPGPVRALDEARLTPAHAGLLLVMALAVTIDVMKPAALAFAAPGMAAEYGLKSPLTPHGHVPVALLPLCGIGGTVAGSFVWGRLGDRIGRRASILLAGVLFVATSVCGAMPGFGWNLVMCFVMGLGVGGMLPVMFTLLAETVPARHRGRLMVLIGGDVAGGYLVTSWLAAELVPHYSWRILWLLGMPTGLLLILLDRWIPESPRFLLAAGREAEAHAIMRRYGAVPAPSEPVRQTPGTGYRALFRRPYAGVSTAVVLLGPAAGLVTYGFQLWLPVNLQRIGFTQASAAGVLRDAALLGLPLNVLAAWLYGRWGGVRTIVAMCVLTASALTVLALVGDRADHALLYAVLVVPLWSASSLAAVLAAYSAEIYPTVVRAHGCGLAAGAGKAAGVLTIALVAAGIAAPSLRVTALAGAVPMVLAAAVFAVAGAETGRRPQGEHYGEF
jgi:putative MFS transporter